MVNKRKLGDGEFETQKDIDETIEICCEGFNDNTVIIRQNNVIIQLLFEIKKQIQNTNK